VEKSWYWKVAVNVAIFLLSILFSLSSLVPAPKKPGEKDLLPPWVRNSAIGINLGLDLQGGLRLVYEVEVDQAVADKRDRMAQGFVDELGRRDVKGAKWKLSGNDTFVLTVPNDKAMDTAKTLLGEYRRDLSRTAGGGGDLELELKLSNESESFVRDQSVRQAIETISNRIDELGLANTTVSRQDVDIIVEIPGIEEVQTARIKRIISQTARLDFRMVDDSGSKEFFRTVLDKLPKDKSVTLESEVINGPNGPTRSYFLKALNSPERSGRQILKKFLKENAEIPTDRTIGYEEERQTDEQGNPLTEVAWRTYFMERRAGITGEYIDNAFVANDDTTGRPHVALSFNRQGADIFANLTEKNVRRRMAIQLDDKVNSAPVIQEKIPGGNARITLGGYRGYDQMLQEAKDLVVVLRAGALPAPVRPITETVIGPLLGKDAIRMGEISSFIGCTIVFFFMIVYYRKTGLGADIALVVNIVSMLAVLAVLGATLTLPGIAGLALTVGMAVDANVLINERIREELRGGKSPRSAIDAGYARAFWTIFDSQLTTFMAGIVMLQYGTGAIKGFAVTLMIGIITSMYTSIIISRLYINFLTRPGKAETLSI